jgi:hypothetical protein
MRVQTPLTKQLNMQSAEEVGALESEARCLRPKDRLAGLLRGRAANVSRPNIPWRELVRV